MLGSTRVSRVQPPEPNPGPAVGGNVTLPKFLFKASAELLGTEIAISGTRVRKGFVLGVCFFFMEIRRLCDAPSKFIILNKSQEPEGGAGYLAQLDGLPQGETTVRLCRNFFLMKGYVRRSTMSIFRQMCFGHTKV